MPKTKQLSGPAHSAKILKGYLRQFFPGVKFSVKSETYSGGSSIDVSYTDGPLLKEVEGVADLFQKGSFDGMTDCYNYHPVKAGCSGAHYVCVTRERSPELDAEILPILKRDYAPRFGTGDRVGDYAPYQIGEAEMILRGIDEEELDRRIEERAEAILALGALVS
jgi:hypothetical protein